MKCCYILLSWLDHDLCYGMDTFDEQLRICGITAERLSVGQLSSRILWVMVNLVNCKYVYIVFIHKNWEENSTL